MRSEREPRKERATQRLVFRLTSRLVSSILGRDRPRQSWSVPLPTCDDEEQCLATIPQLHGDVVRLSVHPPLLHPAPLVAS